MSQPRGSHHSFYLQNLLIIPSIVSVFIIASLGVIFGLIYLKNLAIHGSELFKRGVKNEIKKI